MNITRIGIDLAKQVFQVHGVDRTEKVVVRKQLRRSQMLDILASLRPVWWVWKPAVERITGVEN